MIRLSLTGNWRYVYDPVGNRLVEQHDDSVTTYSYNERNQLLQTVAGGTMRWRGSLDEPGTVAFTSATVNGQPARMLPGNVFEADLQMAPGTNTVTLVATDATGNQTTKQYSLDVAGQGTTYSYDANGNTIQRVEGSGTWTYEWNAENQLVRVQKSAAEIASYRYDAMARRVEAGGAGGTQQWAYDGAGIVRESDRTTLHYVQGPGVDTPLAALEPTGTGYYHADGLAARGGNGGAAHVGLQR